MTISEYYRTFLKRFTVVFILSLVIDQVFGGSSAILLLGFLAALVILVYYANKIRTIANDDEEMGEARLDVAYMLFISLTLITFVTALKSLTIRLDPASTVSETSFVVFLGVSFLITLPIAIILTWRGVRRFRLANPDEETLNRQKTNIYKFALAWFVISLFSAVIVDNAGSMEMALSIISFIFVTIPGTVIIAILGNRITKPKTETPRTPSNKVRELENEIKRLNNAYKSVEAEKNRLKFENNRFVGEKDRLNREVQSKVREVKNLNNRIRELENKRPATSHNFDVSRLNKENTNLKNESRRMKSEINKLKNKIKNMNKGSGGHGDSVLIGEYKKKLFELNQKNHKLNELLQPFESTLKGLTRKELYLAEIKRIRDNPDPRMATKLDVVIRDIVREAPLNVTKLNSAYEKPFYKNAFYDYLKEHASRCSDEADKREFLEREYKMLRQAYDPVTYPTTPGLRRSRTWATERIFDLDESKRRLFDEL